MPHLDISIILIFGLATWRIANMLVHENGPFRIFFRIRKLAGIMMDEFGEPVMIPERFFAELLSCTWCASVWVGAIWTLFWFLFPVIAMKMAVIFSFSATAIVIDKYVKG